MWSRPSSSSPSSSPPLRSLPTRRIPKGGVDVSSRNPALFRWIPPRASSFLVRSCWPQALPPLSATRSGRFSGETRRFGGGPQSPGWRKWTPRKPRHEYGRPGARAHSEARPAARFPATTVPRPGARRLSDRLRADGSSGPPYRLSERPGAPYSRLPGSRFGHRGRKASFDAFVVAYPEKDVALESIADLVRDIALGECRLPQSRGLDTLLDGISRGDADDAIVLERTAHLLDAPLGVFRDEAGT